MRPEDHSMEDETILQPYFRRQEQALTETQAKYGRLCSRVAAFRAER